jgi:acetyltransferase
VLLEQMAPAGIDLVVGARRDPVFGPVVLLGVGGIATEVYADVAIVSADSSPARFARLADDLQARDLLAGFRGGPVVDRDDLARVCGALARLLSDNPHLDEVEINPLRTTPEGLVALDAVFLERTDHLSPTMETIP